MQDLTEETIELSPGEQFADRFFARNGADFRVSLGAGTHVGHVRTNNEDHYAVARRVRTSELLLTNLPNAAVAASQDETYGLIVADGVGGGEFGERASQLALEMLFSLSAQASNWVMRVSEVDQQEMRKRIDSYVDKIQASFRSVAESDPRFSRMATTWTSAYVVAPHVFVSHIGDSRGYLFRGQQLQQITRDQTVAQDLEDRGAPKHEVKQFANLLTNSFGGKQESVTAEIYQVRLQAGDRMMLCTDGLTDMVDDQHIATLLASVAGTQECCDRLLTAALANGGRDNITVVLCDISESVQPAPVT